MARSFARESDHLDPRQPLQVDECLSLRVHPWLVVRVERGDEAGARRGHCFERHCHAKRRSNRIIHRGGARC